jgi:hypothetical protein
MKLPWVERIVIGLILLIGLGIFYVVGVERGIANACLRAGYPAYKMVGFSEGYCIKMVNQTEIVVPLDSIKGR